MCLNLPPIFYLFGRKIPISLKFTFWINFSVFFLSFFFFSLWNKFPTNQTKTKMQTINAMHTWLFASLFPYSQYEAMKEYCSATKEYCPPGPGKLCLFLFQINIRWLENIYTLLYITFITCVLNSWCTGTSRPKRLPRR